MDNQTLILQTASLSLIKNLFINRSFLFQYLVHLRNGSKIEPKKYKDFMTIFWLEMQRNGAISYDFRCKKGNVLSSLFLNRKLLVSAEFGTNTAGN